MRGTRNEMTWADYLAVAVAPVLIMLLVGSLVFFLSDIGYAGEFPGVIRWVLFWFVFGSVMLARVSIEQGAAHAGFLGLGLALATIVALITLVSNALIACLLIGVVWWCAHKLTWNCTFIDETIDPSAAGLLETAGQDERLKDRRIGTRSAAEKIYDPLSEETFRAEAIARLKLAPWWKRAWNAITDLEPRAHAPGLSVLYFSLAALPLFGFGQWLIPANDASRQSSAFRWLTIYLMAGLALLAITSFLGMRRYLRRRTLEMPAAMTSAWVGVSAALIAALLIGGMLLPLPGAQSDLSIAFRDRVLGSPEREASKIAPVKIDGTQSKDPDAARTSEGDKSEDQQASKNNSQEPGGQPDKQGEGTTDQQSEDSEASGSSSENPGEKSGNSESQQSSDEPSESSSDESSSSQQQQQDQDQQQSKSSDGDAPSKQDPAQSGQQGSPPPAPPSHPPTPPNPLGALGSILRPLIWIAIIVAALVLAVVFRHQIIAFLREIAEIWRGIWQLAFPQRAKVVEEAVAPKELPRPFASFANPFRDGRAQRASPDDLVKYTFAALAAWSFEQGAPKLPDETPLEFAARASRQFPELGQDANRLAGWLARSLYARQLPTNECLDTIKSLWSTLEVPSKRGLATAGR